MLTTERLKEIKQRAERATEGPWGVRHRCSGCTPDDDEAAGLGLELVGPPQPLNKGQFARAADAQFCAHAREDVPALVAEVERLHRFVTEIRRTARHWRRRAKVMMAKGKASDRPDDAHWFAGQAEAFEQAAWDLEIILVELLGGNENAE